MNDNTIKIFNADDFAGILSAALSNQANIQGGGQIHEIQAKEQQIQHLTRWGIVEFTDKELKSMPKNIRRLIILQDKRCRIRSRASGKNTTTYEIRYRCKGYDVSASGKTIELAKLNFIEKLKTAQPVQTPSGGGAKIPSTFVGFSTYHFENFKKDKVTREHYKNSLGLFHRYLSPYFKDTPLSQITPYECKLLLDKIKKQGKGKTADDLHSILNGIFKNAIAHGLIERNPLALILHIQHERTNGQALSKDEETTLLNALNGSIFATAAALVLFCGLRPNELETAKIQGDFIKAINSKRKRGKVEYKYIPIINRLRPFLPVDGVFHIPNLDMLRRAVKQALPHHKLYDLRTTFYTRCDELGVAAAARDEFVGHSSGVLTNTYRDLSMDYLRKEGEKLNAW